MVRIRRKILRNGRTRKATCHQFRLRNLTVLGATTSLAMNSAANMSQMSQPATVSPKLRVVPLVARDSPMTTRTNTTDRALIIGVSRSSNSSAQISRSTSERLPPVTSVISPGLAIKTRYRSGPSRTCLHRHRHPGGPFRQAGLSCQ